MKLPISSYLPAWAQKSDCFALHILMSKCGSQLSFESGMTPRHLTLWPKSTLLLPMRSHPYKISVGIIPASQKNIFFWFGAILGSASRAKFPVSLSNHVGFTPRLLYSSTHHSPENFTHLKIGWPQDAWLQWSYENWYFHLDISRWTHKKNNIGNFFLPPRRRAYSASSQLRNFLHISFKWDLWAPF